MKTKLLLLPIIVLLITCCKDEPKPDPNGLPPETHEGKNTFGCLIDGQPFVASVNFTVGGVVAVSGSYNESSNLLNIVGTREDAQKNLDVVKFFAYIENIGTVSNMYVTVDDYEGYQDYSGVDCSFYHNPNDKGSVTITYLSTDQNIIAGTFSMTLVNPNCSSKQIMSITSGRFDFGY